MSRYGEQALLSEGDRLRFATAHGERHQALMTASLRMAQLVAGGELDGDRAWGKLFDAGEVLGLPKADARKHIEKGWSLGLAQPRFAPTAGRTIADRLEAMLIAVDLWEDMCRHPWLGRSGAADQKMIAAFLLKVIEIGKIEITLSARQWAEAAGMNRSSIARRWLGLQPWIVRTARGSSFSGDSTKWKLGCAPRRENWDSPSNPEGLASAMSQNPRLPPPGGCDDPSGDLFHGRPGLWVVRNLLDPEGPDLTVRAIREVTGLHQSTIRSYLHEMAGWGLVERLDDKRTWRALGAQVDPEVLQLTPAYGAERESRHALERARYAQPRVDLETGELAVWVAWSDQPVQRGARLATTPATPVRHEDFLRFEVQR